MNMTFVQHMEELRKRIVVSVIALLLCSLASYFFAETILEFLTIPLKEQTPQLYFFSPTEAFLIKIKTSFFSGMVLSSPVILTQVWGFVAPGLYQKERKMFIPWTVVMTLLFLLGITFCFVLVLPIALEFLMGMQTNYLKPLLSMRLYINFVIFLLLAFGFCFNLPLFILALVAMKILRVATLLKYQKHAIVGVFILSALLTPPDMASQLLLSIPLIVLYEASILGAWMWESSRKNKTELESTS